MKKYRVSSPLGLSFAAGAILALDAALVQPMKPNSVPPKKLPPRFGDSLKPVKDSEGQYEVVAPIMLKRGIEFGYAGELPKALAELVEDLSPKELLPEGGQPGAKKSAGKK